MNRGRPLLRGFLAAGLSWLLLLGAIALGMVVPRLELLSGFGAGGSLDYSTHASGFSPLSLAFIADILGLDSPSPTGTGGSATGSVASAASGVSSAADGPRSGPTEVEHPFTNDDVDDAYPITSLPFRARTNTTDGTRSADEPVDCSPAGGTAWYRYRPRSDVALFSDTFGTERATALGVYSRGGSGPLEPIGCDRNALGNAQVGFRAEANTTYYFQVTSIVRGGPTIFELAAVGRTTGEDLSPLGEQADDPVWDRADISADGRYLVFISAARNLAPVPASCDGSPNCDFLFLRDRVARKTMMIASIRSPLHRSLDLPGFLDTSISADGRYVGFTAFGNGSDPLGFEGASDAEPYTWNTYIYDRTTRRYELVSRNSAGDAARGEPVDRTARGVPPNGGGHFMPSLSADGRYVVFNSDGANMGHEVEPGVRRVYRRDRVTGITRLVSTDRAGKPMDGASCAATGRNVSGDGRYVVFMNEWKDTRVTLVYLWDAWTGRSRLVSKIPAGTEPQGSYCPSISLDGSRVGLVSLDPLVRDDTNGTPDVYVYDVSTLRIQRISVTSAGRQTYDPNYVGREHGQLGRAVNFSADGRFAVFDSAAPGLAPSAVGSTRHPPQTTRVFLHDMLTGATVLVSVSSAGEPLPGDSHMPYISPGGNAVAFLNTGTSGWQAVMVHELSLFR